MACNMEFPQEEPLDPSTRTTEGAGCSSWANGVSTQRPSTSAFIQKGNLQVEDAPRQQQKSTQKNPNANPIHAKSLKSVQSTRWVKSIRRKFFEKFGRIQKKSITLNYLTINGLEMLHNNEDVYFSLVASELNYQYTIDISKSQDYYIAIIDINSKPLSLLFCGEGATKQSAIIKASKKGLKYLVETCLMC